ncbi:MAG: hypothetical protein MJZ77_00695 [Bacteroidales bacterium]|nr:hypothetical protein [Bacteroidales bacterium]
MANSISFSIGGHYLKVEGNREPALLHYAIPGFATFLTASSDEEWKVVFGSQIEQPAQWEVMYNFVFAEVKVDSVFAKANGAYYFSMVPKEGDGKPLLMRYCGGDVVEATMEEDPQLLRFAMWMAVNMLAARSKMTLVHSSVLVHDNRAVLCLGESGTGKSTHTKLWMENIPGTHRLNDDSPVLAVENGEAVVYGSPWSGKSDYYIRERYPLAGVIRLSQGPKNVIRRLGVLEAFSSLQPSCPPALAQDSMFQDLIVDLVSDVIACTPIFHLSCLPNADAAWTSHDAIFGNLK